MPLTFL